MSLFRSQIVKLNAEVMATALNVFATTASLGGSTAQAYGFMVNSAGLGAYSWNVGFSGPAFGVPSNSTLDVYQLLLAANNSAVNGDAWDSQAILHILALSVFDTINGAGGIH
jgi:hypothetical protein